MEQTAAHENHNPDLLKMLPANARRIVEVGCSSGALAREYRKLNPACHYIGIEVVPEYAQLARRHCDEVRVLDIESVDESELGDALAADCWVFGDTLEHLRDPWTLLARIARRLGREGSVVACIPNAQHWSLQARLSCGALRYENEGLLDRSHLRWFTRQTILEMFAQAGLAIVAGVAREFGRPEDERVMQAIRLLASAMGSDPEAAARDAIPLQYVVRATPTRAHAGGER